MNPPAARPIHPDALARAGDLAWHAETVFLLALSPDGVVAGWNEAAWRGTGGVLREGIPAERVLTPNSLSLLRATMRRPRGEAAGGILLTFSDGERYALTLSCRVAWAEDACLVFGEPLAEREREMNRELVELSGELARITREKAKVAAELKQALEELRASHWQIRKIQEFLPICTECHRVPAAAAQGEGWTPLVSFLAGNGLLMTHGYCPECEARVLAALDAAPPAP